MSEEADPGKTYEEWALPSSDFVDELDAYHEPPERPRNPDGTFAPTKTTAKTQPEGTSSDVSAPAAAVPPPEPPKHSHSRHLAQMALDLGQTQAEIDAASPEALQERVYHLNRQLHAFHENERRLAPREQNVAPAPPPEPEDELAELEDLPEHLDDRFVGFLRRLARENRELKAAQAQQQNIEQQRRNESRDEWVDRLFDEHADEGKFGRKSAGKGLTQDQLLRRKQILYAASLKAGPGASERAIIELVPVVLKDLFGDSSSITPSTPSTPSRTNGARVSPEEWEEAALLRPTQRGKPQEPKGTRRAERAVVDMLRDKNVRMDEDGGIEEAGLPE